MLKEKKGKIFVLILVFSLLAVFAVMANDKPGLFGILDMEPDELDDFDFTPLPSCEEGETLIFSDDEWDCIEKWDCIENDGFSGAGCYFNEEEYIKLLAAYYDETGGDMTTVEELQNYFEDATYDPVHHFLDYFTHDYETDYNDKKPREVIEVAIENDIINDFPFRCDGSAIENGGVVPQNGADSGIIGGGYCAEIVDDGHCGKPDEEDSTWVFWGVGSPGEEGSCEEGEKITQLEGEHGIVGFLCEGDKELQTSDEDVIGGGYCAETLEDEGCGVPDEGDSTWFFWGVGASSTKEDGPCLEGEETDQLEGDYGMVGFLCE